ECGRHPCGGALVATRPYLSIGEVLTLLKDEFPDITISKIRFLESQGLLDPERTPSGYRKFYDDDVARLRWILRQQREHFLPLKVIKGRLAGGAVPGAETTGAWPEEPAAAPDPVNETPRPAAVARGAATAARLTEGPDPLTAGHTGASLTLTELAAATGLEPDDVRELERFGLLDAHSV